MLDGVQFRLESRFGQHRFGLARHAAARDRGADRRARRPRPRLVSGWRNAAGRIYLRLDYADVAAWSEWIPMPLHVQSGQGAMRVWFEFAQGVARDVVADLELADVRTQLEADLPPLDLAHLSGRVTWQQEGRTRSLATRGLEFVERAGVAIAPTSLDLRYEVGPRRRVASGRIASSRLDLGRSRGLASQLPLPAEVRDDSRRHAPHGHVSEPRVCVGRAVRRAVDVPGARRVRRSSARRPSMRSPDSPGGSGRFDATQAGGTIAPRKPQRGCSRCRKCSPSRSRSTARAGASNGSAAAGEVSVQLR